MKTLKLKDKVIRVKEEKVDGFINAGYKFCPKSEFKKLVKPEKEEKTTVSEEKTETVKDKKEKISKKVKKD